MPGSAKRKISNARSRRVIKDFEPPVVVRGVVEVKRGWPVDEVRIRAGAERCSGV